MDENCETYNINADDAACAIARAVGADKLVFLTDVEGLYKDFSDKSSFISRITASDAEALVSSGEIGGGMLPKLKDVYKRQVYHTVSVGLDDKIPSVETPALSMAETPA